MIEKISRIGLDENIIKKFIEKRTTFKNQIGSYFLLYYFPCLLNYFLFIFV